MPWTPYIRVCMTSVRLPASWYLVGQSCVLMNWRHGLRVSEGQGKPIYITHKMELGDIHVNMTAFMLYCIARNFGGLKNWRIWRISLKPPKF